MQALERAGYRVDTVPDGASALRMMADSAPDVVVIDLRMPGMPGEEFLSRALEIDPEMVAVAITGHPTLGSAIDVMKAGAYDYLPKPFNAEELRIVIERACQRRHLAMAVSAGERERRLMRDNFVAMVSHQLKSPAASAKECLDSALAAFGGQVPDGCRDLMERAARRMGLLLDLMGDWLTLARVESGGLTAGAEPLDVCAVVEAAVSAARERSRAGASVDFRSGSRPILVVGDEEALRELFFNLVDNALRYTPDGGAVSVTVEADGRWAVAQVTDTGPGIPPGEQPLVFEPFFRGESAKSREGTGLGLPIARQIAETHGGRIVLESKEGEGTTFKVFLPREERAVISNEDEAARG
jgi:two-component system sensor histidine kinase/response regulator